MAELNTKSDYIIKASAGANRTKMGGKAAVLAELDTQFSIPEWFVVSPLAFLDSLSDKQREAFTTGTPIGEIGIAPAVQAEIEQALAVLMGQEDILLAVRSSATAEDGEHASFAGQLQSYLNVSPEAVCDRVRDVWYSAFAEHVTHYRNAFAQHSDWIPAVIVQRMVDAEVAGVVFSANPVSGDRHQCVINATAGLADKLVSGEVKGDTYLCDKAGQIQRQNDESAILPPQQVEQVCALASMVEAHFQQPQDIEWAIAKGTLYLLQARPITTLSSGASTGAIETIWDNSNIVESYSGVTSPLTFSFARYVYEHVYIAFCQLMKVSNGKIEQNSNTFRNVLGFINGHVYYNLLNWYRMLALFPGFTMNRKFMEQMMGVKEALPVEMLSRIAPDRASIAAKLLDGVALGWTFCGLVWQQIRLPKTIKRFYQRLDQALSLDKPLEVMALDELAGQYRALESQLLKQWDAPLINDFLCMVAFGGSRKLLEKNLGEDGLRLHNDILIGQGDIISAEPARRIQQMADSIRAEPAIVSRLVAGDRQALAMNSSLKQAVEDYLEKFGDRCLQELKLESPTLRDDPTLLLQAIGFRAQRPGKSSQQSVMDVNMVLAQMLPRQRFKRWLIGKSVHWAKARVRDRENLRFERTRIFGRVRQIFLHIGKHLHTLGHMDSARDVFFLEVGEIMGLIEGSLTTRDVKGLIALRREQQTQFLTQATPPNRFTTRGASFPAFIQQDYQQLVSNQSLDANSVKGIGCCQGIVRATVRVIHDPRDARLVAGEILVAEFTDPGWITLFANAAGILVARGSLLSHSAIVSREMGIPAIVAIDGVMNWLQTGDVVEMNGSTGVVRKIQSGESHG